MQTTDNHTGLTGQAEKLQKQGEVVFATIARQLNQLQPGRERTREEFEQVCIALALFIHHLLDSDGDDPDL